MSDPKDSNPMGLPVAVSFVALRVAAVFSSGSTSYV